MVKLLVIQDPHYKFFIVRFKVFVGNPWNLFFSFSPNSETVVAFSISYTTTCFKGLLELRKDGETRQQLMDVTHWTNTESQSVKVCALFWLSQSLLASHHLPMTFSCCLLFSHFQRKSYECWAVQTLSFKICLSAIYFSFLACERHFLSFPVVCVHVRHLLTLFLLVPGQFLPSGI